MPILSATWPSERFLSSLLTLIQSPIVFMLSGKGLALELFLPDWVNLI